MRLPETNLFQEIFEQPQVVRNLLDSQQPITEKLASAIKERNITHIVIAARGTSDNAGLYAKYVLGVNNRLLVMLATPSLYTLYHSPPRFGQALVLGISQSGKSPDIVSVLAEAKTQGNLTAVITNNPDSPLAEQGDFVIDLMAGEELAVAATKTYTAELAAIALLSAKLANEQQMLSALEQIPANISATLSMSETVAACAEHYLSMRYAAVIGRGFNYATAFEAALKLKEMSYTIVEPYSSADFMHGPLALLEPGYPVIMFAVTGATVAESEQFFRTLANHEAAIIAVSDIPGLLARSKYPLSLPVTVPEWLSPLTAIIPGQLFAMHLAHQRGFDVDSPRGIQKVTETS